MQHTFAENIYGRYAVPVESNYTFTSRTILQGAVHEPTTIDYIIKNCGDGDIVHAGAGFGDFLPALSKACHGTVFTFEPNLVNYEACMETMRLNKLDNAVLYKTGLGTESTKAHLRVKEAGLALGVRSEVTIYPADGTQEIELATLDSIMMPRYNQISLIHLDIEGYEFRALDGAREVIKRDAPIIILEIDGRALDYNRYMQAIGYKPAEQLIYNAGDMVFVNTVYKKT